MTPTIQSALRYAERGWSIVPIVTGTKRPPKGFDLTRRFTEPAGEDQIRRWFGAGEFSMAVCLGDVSDGLTCRDFDDESAYHQWAESNPRLAGTLPTARTPRGRHVYFTSDRADFGERQILVGRDGELKRGGYVLLPESVHPTGTRYQWLRDADPPFVGDLLAAGFLPSEGGLTQDIIRDFGSESLWRGTLTVEQAIETTQPTGQGMRHHCLFRFVRLLKATPLADGSQDELRAVFDRWFRLAKPRIRTKDRRTSWCDFLEGWRNVRVAFGATMDRIAAGIEGAGIDRLESLCRELQRIAGERPFHLNCRTAGKVLGVSHETAAKWLRILRCGPLELVTQGCHRMHRASEYRYKQV